MAWPSWVLSALGCPVCQGRLARAKGVVRCARCGPYPVLGDVPVLVPNPFAWCAAFHDAALAALAEAGRVTPRDVETLEAFAAGADAEPSRFSDDWTRTERDDSPPPPFAPGPAVGALEALANGEGPSSWLAERVRPGVVLEVGCGAGLTARRLPSRRLLVGDQSLRAVLVAARRARAFPVVLDAQAVPCQPGSLDTVVAENVVDLLDDPTAFFDSSHAALSRTGALLLSTPAPSLGAPDGDDDTLLQVARAAGFTVIEQSAALPWLRRNTSRFIEVWLASAYSFARKRAGRTR